MDIKNKTITLNDGEKYVVIDLVEYANRSFALLTKVLDDGSAIDNQLYVAETNIDKLVFVNDQLLVDEVLRIFRSK